MDKKRNLSVNPHPDGWEIKRDGGDRASKVTTRKQDAVDAARDMARRDGVELTIRGKDGKIQQKDSYGSDPFPPRDKEH